MPSASASALAPKEQENAAAAGRRKLVPKKSKLSILGLGSSSSSSRREDRDKGRDFSDVVRRVGASDQVASSSMSMNLKGGFEIYVDPTVDPDIGEIVMIKKKKSRAALDGVRWGASGSNSGALQEVQMNANLPKAKDGLLKPKTEEKETAKEKWWTLGRGRKDSKEDKKKDKENKISHKPIEYIHDPQPRSKTPDPFRPSSGSISKGSSKPESRGRFNSLGSSFLLGGGSSSSQAQTEAQTQTQAQAQFQSQASNSVRGMQAYKAKSSLPPLSSSYFQSAPYQPSVIPMPMDDDEEEVQIRPSPSNSNVDATYSRSGTPTFGGLLAPPGAGAGNQQGQGQGQGQGSIALRAIRSVRSLARMGSWAQLKNMPAPDDEQNVANPETVDKDKGTVKEKKTKKSKSGKENKDKDKGVTDDGEEGKKKKKSVKKEKAGKAKKDTKKEKEKTKEKPKASTVRLSSSSFEIGALTASPGPGPAGPTFTVNDNANLNANGGYASSTYNASPVNANFNINASANSANQKTLGPGAKKQSTLLGGFSGLGLGLPSSMSMRLPSVRAGSSASSKYEVPAPGSAASLAPGPNSLLPAAVITSKGKPERTGTAGRSATNPNEVIANIINNNRLSVESARMAQVQGYHPSTSSVNLVGGANANRASSVLSSGSSLRPVSTSSMGSVDRRLSSASGSSRLSAVSGASGVSQGSGLSQGSVVKWDEEGLQSARETRRKERAERERAEREKEKMMSKEERRSSRESRRSSEGRRRTPLTEIFPGVALNGSLPASAVGAVFGKGDEMVVDNSVQDVEMRDVDDDDVERDDEDIDERRQRRFEYPILTIEEATNDGHGAYLDDDEEEGDVALGSEEGSVDEQEQVYEEKAKEEKKMDTPVKKARARPLSEQLLGKSRPKAMYEDDEGVLSILDAATNDLALLINNLDLQATPSSIPGDTPLRPSPSPGSVSPTPFSTLEKEKDMFGSVKKRTVVIDSPLGLKSAKKAGSALLARQTSTASISSLRPYAQSRGLHTATITTAMSKGGNNASSNSNAALIGQQIAPWATLIKGLSPVKEKRAPAGFNSNQGTIRGKPASPPATISSGTFKLGHKRTMTPGPEPEPEPVLQPLKPPRSRAVFTKARLLQIPAFSSSDKKEENKAKKEEEPERAPSSMTFGDRSSVSTPSEAGSLTPVFKRIQEYEMFTHKSSLGPHDVLSGSRSSSRAPSSRSGSKGSRSSYGSILPRSTLSFHDNQSDAEDDLKEGDQLQDFNKEYTFPIARETRKVLGMSGTMGGSDVSCYGVGEPLDVSDPDSDVPDELRVILKESEDRKSVIGYADRDEAESEESHVEVEFGRSQLASDGGLPPSLALELDLPAPPVFRASLVDEQDNHLGLDLDDLLTSEEDTKKSFDFTGELKKLNESGGSDRRSFVEQLENAFRTPAKVDLKYDLSFGALGLNGNGMGKSMVLEVPPWCYGSSRGEDSVIAWTSASASASDGFDSLESSQSQLVNFKLPNMTTMEKTRSEVVQQNGDQSNSQSQSRFDMFSASRIVDVKEPTIMQGADSLESNGDEQNILKPSLAASTSSRTSDGELNTSFRFGGLPRQGSSCSIPKEKKDEKPLTLSDIIPPPSHVRSVSGMDSYMLEGLEDDSVLKSIYAQMINGMPSQRPRVNSDSSTHQSAEERRRSIYRAASRPASGISFQGFDSFEEVRRGFEFSGERQPFYPPPAASVASRRAPHNRHESVFSIASVSSYGHVINPGSNDPFDYGLPSLRERPSSEDMSSISMSMSIDDTFAFLPNRARRRVESDASSFYFRPLQARGHRRRESNMSVTSQAPPISLYNRSFEHRRNDSSASTSSVAMSYVKHAWARHRKDQSFDSVVSDFSGMHLGRPGLGDKMFDMQAPLTAISASPPESVSGSQEPLERRRSFDSIMDADPRPGEDSLFDKTGHRTSVSSESVFGDDYSHPYEGSLLPPNHFRPLSVLSHSSVHSPMREDDTMISMLGGGHVRRRSVGSIIEASPCVRVEKRKHSAFQNVKTQEHYESPNNARIVEKPSIASTSSQFGGERMIRAQHGLLERQSLEESCLMAEGEDLSIYVPVFTRPAPSTRSRSSTYTSSSGTDTPPLSASDGSSISGGSQSSIDLSHINIALANATHPVSTISMNRARARAPGTGHRRRYSKANISRTSVYETIEEERPGSNQTTPAHSILSKKSSPTTRQAIYVVDSDAASVNLNPEDSVWDDERGIVALRKYYALRDEAHETVSESRRQWRDTPFSLFAIQTFQAPGSPGGMQALLEHSVQNYGPLPSELRSRRVRTNSRPSPYPQRSFKSTLSPEHTRSSMADLQRTPVLQPVIINKNIMHAAPSLEAIKPFSPLVVDIEPKRENAFGLAPNARPRVGSNARRTALGWSKRSTGKTSTDQKENAVGTGALMTPGDNLRLNRPRPRGRTPGGRTPATQTRPIRI
ncbi:hypothetical protein CPB84DRAFT_1810241 [Gymnopilus junonius]|uniref:Uncharacterized protein n=1 Tax=Gymnopilus junonius TaxID=109634 RepID=A0A9P5N7I7_GYMJU|nr:hypothetical protein CPB84DRAFT_1810241 [Gymnopilus junonius]